MLSVKEALRTIKAAESALEIIMLVPGPTRPGETLVSRTPAEVDAIMTLINLTVDQCTKPQSPADVISMAFCGIKNKE